MRFFVFLYIVLFSLNSIAGPECYLEPKTPENQEGLVTQMELQGLKDDYAWLYDELMSEEFKTGEDPEYVEKSFYTHFADTNKFFPHPDELINFTTQLKAHPMEIRGKITYAGFVAKKYKYDVYQEANESIIEVRVHLKNATPEDVVEFTREAQEATDIWNDNRWEALIMPPLKDPIYKFRFLIVEKDEDPHFSVRVKDNTRGPYDTNWSRGWIGVTIAHEVGHMMGLGDEYNLISGKMKCVYYSLMCNSFSGVPKKHHYYFVLRRLLDHPDND